jgi:glycosyltransferase involved in cell wall biosynthesis
MPWHPPKSLLKHHGRTANHPVVCVNNKGPANHLYRAFLIFSPWCDQGLGHQAKTYVQWLQDMGHRAVVFACKPSKKSSAKCPSRMQANWDEWANVTVKYHAKTREEVPHEDVVSFAKENGVTDALMLETCHMRIFVISAALSRAGVRVFAVPNIELVRRCEVQYFRDLGFHRVLCNNQYTLDVLKYFGVPRAKLANFPYSPRDVQSDLAELHRPGNTVRFLLVGGMNAERRKQAGKVIHAFQRAFSTDPRAACLTVLCQGTDYPRVGATQPNVHIVKRHLTYADVLQYYARSHVVVMLSRAEGIGLSLHEAMRARCAILSMETSMFKELVQPNVNGWLIGYKVEKGTEGAKLIGNDDPVVHTYTFDPRVLSIAFQTIVGADVARMQEGARRAFELMYAPERVVTTYTLALGVA